MPITLSPNERLVYAGRTALRAPDGKLLEGVPQYIILPVEKAAPASVVELQDGECLILAGTIHNDREAAEERFAAAKDGHACPRADGTPIYVKEAVENVNKKTGLSLAEEAACEPLIGELLASFAMTARKMKALSKQRKAAR
jgi:non-ribosomal peptide synthetase component F